MVALALILTACGPGARETLNDSEFVTVTDRLTGKAFRCLYVDGDYAANMLCYELDKEVTDGR